VGKAAAEGVVEALRAMRHSRADDGTVDDGLA